MAITTAEMQIVIKAQTDADKVLKGLSSQLKDIDKQASTMSKALGAAGTAMKGLAVTGAVGGVLAVAAGAQKAVEALTGGVGLANSVEQVKARLNAFTKDGAETERILEQIRSEADKTPFSFNAMANAAAMLLPASKSAQGGLEGLIREAEILAALNPSEGLEGAAFALREALSGDFVSVMERFNIPRELINRLKAEGVPNAQIVGRALEEMGADFSLVSNLAQTTSGRFSTFQDGLARLQAAAGEPILEALGVALDEASKALDENKAALTEAARAIGTTLAGAIRASVALLQEWGPRLRDAFEAVGELKDGVGEALGNLRDFATGLGEGVQQSGVLQTGLDALSGVVQAVSGAIQAAAPVVQGLADRFAAFASEVAPLVGAAFESIQRVVGTVLGAVGNLIATNLALFQAQWAEHGGTITTIVSALWGALSGVVEAGLSVISGTIRTVLQLVAGDWQGAWQTMITTATTALGQLAGAIGALAGPIAAKAAEIGQAIVNGISNGIRGGIGAVTAAAAGVAQAALSAAKSQLGIASPSREFEEVGEDVVAGLVDGIDSVAGDAIDAVESMVAEMNEAAGDLNLVDAILGGLDTKGQDALANFLHDSEDVIEQLGRKAQEVGEKAARALADARDDAAEAIQDVREGAASRALELVDNQSLSREIRAVRERFGDQQDEADRAYKEQREDADLTYKYEKDLAKAKTSDERAEVRARFKEATDDLALRRQQDEADRAFRKQQNAALQAFNDRLEDEGLQRQIKRLQEERDKRITEITAALSEKERKVVENEARERAALAQSAQDKLADLKEKFFDKVGPLMEGTRDQFETLFAGIAAQVGAAAGAVNDLAAAIARVSGARVSASGGGSGLGPGDIATWANQPQAAKDAFTAQYGADPGTGWAAEHPAEARR
jgi:phage-related protein